MSGMNNNPLMVIGLNRRNIRQFSQNIPAFRSFLRNYRRLLAPLTHPDVSNVSDRFSAEINAAFSEIEAMGDMELKETVDSFVQDEDDMFGIRRDLKNLEMDKQSLSRKLKIAQEEDESKKKKLAAMSANLKNELNQLFVSLVPKRGEGLFVDVSDLYGYVFANYPTRSCMRGRKKGEAQLVEGVEVHIYYVHSNGLVYENSISQKYDSPVSIRHSNWSFRAKVEHYLQNFQLGSDWKELGWLIGFSDLGLTFPSDETVDAYDISQMFAEGELKRTNVCDILYPTPGRTVRGSCLAIAKPAGQRRFILKRILPASHSPFKPVKR